MKRRTAQPSLGGEHFFFSLLFFPTLPKCLKEVEVCTTAVLSPSASRPFEVGALDSQVAIGAGRQVQPNTWVRGIHAMETRQRYSLPRTQMGG